LSVRIFVAAELPGEVVEALADWCPRDDGLRRLPVESLHVTLAFLGWREDADMPVVGDLLEPLARPVGGLAVGEALWLPKRRPRVLSVRIEDGRGQLGVLQAEAGAAIRAAIDWEPEHREFLPHLTVARTRVGARPGPVEPPPDLGPFAATALTLFRSHLGPGGSRYEAVARASL
jgi:RNA 2',3'-cyclic 3'-phosphodiesterase